MILDMLIHVSDFDGLTNIKFGIHLSEQQEFGGHVVANVVPTMGGIEVHH